MDSCSLGDSTLLPTLSPKDRERHLRLAGKSIWQGKHWYLRDLAAYSKGNHSGKGLNTKLVTSESKETNFRGNLWDQRGSEEVEGIRWWQQKTVTAH